MLRIFVAGGTGVIGRRVIPELVASGFRVTASSRSDKSRATLSTLGAEPVTMNLFDAADVKRAVGEQDVVINLTTHVPPSTARAFYEKPAVLGIITLILLLILNLIFA